MPSWPIWKTTSELGSGSVRAIRTIALGRDRAHAGVAVERRALRNAERRAVDVALHVCTGLERDHVAGGDVAGDVALDDDRAAGDVRADRGVRHDHQTVIGRAG